MDIILKNVILVLILMLILLMIIQLFIRLRSLTILKDNYESKKDRPKFLYKGQGRIRTGYRS